MNNSNNWLSSFENDNNWAKNLDEVPSMIVYSYNQLKEFVHDGQVYGTMLILKDIYELIIKVPVIMSLILINNDEEIKGTLAYDGIIQTTLSIPLNMGLWERLAGEIQRAKFACIPSDLTQLLKKTRELYREEVGEYKDIVFWRNDSIGHGALKLECDESYQTEIKTLIVRLKSYFDGGKSYSINGLYKSVYFSSNDQKLVGNNVYAVDSQQIQLYVANQPYPIDNFVSSCDFKLLLFDSYSGRKKITHFISYLDGLKNATYNKFFDELYRRYVYSSSTNFALNATYIKKYEDRILECLVEPPDYERPVFLIERIETELEKLGKGIISIHMERGTGKSSFANYMSGYFHSKSLIWNSFSRCYHVSNANLKGMYDFINKLNTEFRSFYHSEENLVSSTEEIKELKLDTNNPSLNKANMAEFLNFYHEIYGNDYTILVIDGIDEMTNRTEAIMDYIPSQDMLNKGVFIILTSRFEDEKTVIGKCKNYIREGLLRSQVLVEYTRKSEENKKLMRTFILKQKRTEVISGQEIESLMERADYRFLYLKALLVIDNYSLDNSDETVFIQSYLRYLFSFYGKAQKNKIIKLAVYIALLSQLSITNYCECFPGEESTYELMGLLNDLMPLLTVVHKDGESIYEYADSAYSQYIIKTYNEEACELVDSFFYTTEHIIRSDYKYELPINEHYRLLYYSECLLSLWNNTITEKEIRKRFYLSTEVYHIALALQADGRAMYGYGQYLYKELINCINEIIEHCLANEEVGIEHYESLIWKKLNPLSYSYLEKIEGLLWNIEKHSGIQSFYRQISLIIDKSENPSIWYWVIFHKPNKENLQHLVDKTLLRDFVDFLNNHIKKTIRQEAILTIMECLLDCEMSTDDETFLLNRYIDQCLFLMCGNIDDIDRFPFGGGDKISSKLLSCISRMREEDYDIEQEVSDRYYNLDFELLAKEGLLREALNINIINKAIDSLKDRRLTVKQWENVFHAMSVYGYDMEAIYSEIYDCFLFMRQRGEFNEFVEKVDFPAYYYQHVFETTSKREGYLLTLIDWIQYLLEDNTFKATFETAAYTNIRRRNIRWAKIISELMVLLIKWMEKHHQYKDALEMLEEYVFSVDSVLYYLRACTSEESALKIPESMRKTQPTLIGCSNNALYLLEKYYQSHQEQKVFWLIKKIEESTDMAMRWARKTTFRLQEVNELFFYRLMFARKQIGYSDEFDARLTEVLQSHKAKIEDLIASISPYSDYFELNYHFISILNYSWQTMDFQYGVNYCCYLEKKLKVIESNTDNRIVREALREYIVTIKKYYDFLAAFLKEPDADEDEEDYYDLKHPFEEGEIRVNYRSIEHDFCFWEIEQASSSDARYYFELNHVSLQNDMDELISSI